MYHTTSFPAHLKADSVTIARMSFCFRWCHSNWKCKGALWSRSKLLDYLAKTWLPTLLFGWTVLPLLLVGTGLEFDAVFGEHSGSLYLWVFRCFLNVLRVRCWTRYNNNRKRSRHWEKFLENRYSWNSTVSSAVT